MWLLINETLDNKAVLLSAGKALCLCQKFESTCKDIIMWLCLSKSLHEKDFNFLSEKHITYVDKLHNLLLGNSIQTFREEFKNKINKENLEILKDAKGSRNFICHELLKDFVSASFAQSKKYELDKRKLLNHIINIAKGDYLVSKWSYEFHEKKPGGFYDKNKYIDRISTWIFS